MKNLSESLTVPLSSSAHCLAEQFWRQQSNPQQAKQVYLNTLAVSAVDFYLRCMEIETDWQASQSWNPVMQSLMNVADLEVKNHGKLECRPVLPEMQAIYIPPEVWSDRIGYVAVQLDPSLQEAMLLGFTRTASAQEVPLSQLQSLADLLEHLSQIRQSVQISRLEVLPVRKQVNLSQWFGNCFEAGWQSLKSLLGTDEANLAFSLRSGSKLDEANVKRAKLVDLGLELGSQPVALLVAIAQEADQEVGVLVQVHPIGRETCLPSHLRLSLLSESGETLQEVQSRSQDDYIQLKGFQGLPGECFIIQVAFEGTCVRETFVI